MRTRRGKAPRTSKFPASVENLILRCVCWHYAERGRTKSVAHARLSRMIRLINAVGRRRFSSWQDLPVPNAETVRLRIDKSEDLAAFAAKNGARRARLYFAGTKPLTAPFVRHTVMIDSTTADEWCGYREETLVPLGRPTVYYAVDVRSRMNLSYLWFGPPSLEGIMAMIKRVLIEWGRVENIVIDNSMENRSPSLKEALKGAGIELVYAPVATPEFKAIVEKLVDNTNKAIFHRAPGGSVPFPVHLMRRFDLDPKTTTSVTVADLQRQLDHHFNEVVPNRIHSGIGEKPGLVWRRETQERKFQMVPDLQNLLAGFGKMEVVTLSREGVKLRDGLRFYDPVAVTNLLSDLANRTPHGKRRKFSAKATVKVVVDPSDISYALVYNSKTHQWVRLNNQHVTFGKTCATRWEYQQVKAWADEQNLAFSTEAQQLDALWKLQTLISSAAPEQLDKARKRHLALIKKREADTRGDIVVDATDADYAPDGKPKTGADCGVKGIPTLTADTIATGDPLPRKGVRPGGAKAIARQKATMAKKRAETEAKDAVEAPAQKEPIARQTPVAAFPTAADAFAAISDDVLEEDWVKGKTSKTEKSEGKGKG